jgi:DNA-binding response OmpR family regulator
MDASRPKTAARVLLVEDDPNIRELVELHLQLEGLTVASKSDGNDALALARSDTFELIVLDLMLPGLDGVTLCRAIRRDSRNTDVPILMLTARRDEVDKVLGLDSGADDYARVRALLRRRRRPIAGEHAPSVQAGPLLVEPARRQARLGDREIELTAHEFELLYVLAGNRGIVFSRDALVQRVWGEDTHITVRSVDTLVKRLRRKLEKDPADPQYILTVWGSGYKFADA